MVIIVEEGGVGQAQWFEKWVQRGEVVRLAVEKWMRVGVKERYQLSK